MLSIRPIVVKFDGVNTPSFTSNFPYLLVDFSIVDLFPNQVAVVKQMNLTPYEVFYATYKPAVTNQLLDLSAFNPPGTRSILSLQRYPSKAYNPGTLVYNTGYTVTCIVVEYFEDKRHATEN
jgi:hypothetical protein